MAIAGDPVSSEIVVGGKRFHLISGETVELLDPKVRGPRRMAWPTDRLLAGETARGMRWAQGVALSADVMPSSLFGRVPESVLSCLSRFPSHHWSLLEFSHNHPHFLDLLKANPVLAFVLAANADFRSTTPESAAKRAAGFAARKQRDICGLLGFPGTDATVRFLKRIEPEAANVSLLRMLRSSLPLAAATAKVVAHLDRINAGD